MIALRYYSPDYQTARIRFRSAASEANALQEHHRLIPAQCLEQDLSIDVAVIGSEKPEWTVVVSSGLHGIEGFFGSAVQLAFLSQISSGRVLPGKGRIVVVHAINPYGFHNCRRVNEDNVDLNRNFILDDQTYKGRPDGYDRLYDLLNPKSPPSLLDPYWIKAVVLLFRKGLPALKEYITAGQYDYPEALFFGGQRASFSTCVLQANLPHWIGGTANVVHVDFHTGLGKFGTYKLLLPAEVSDPDWYRKWFGAECVETPVDENGDAYRSTGTMGSWLIHRFRGLNYRCFNAEFGTYSEIHNLAALRSENRAHLYGQPDSAANARAKARIKECFCPASKKWRISSLEQGLEIIDRSINALESG
jgi:hypothetical protein